MFTLLQQYFPRHYYFHHQLSLVKPTSQLLPILFLQRLDVNIIPCLDDHWSHLQLISSYNYIPGYMVSQQITTCPAMRLQQLWPSPLPVVVSVMLVILYSWLFVLYARLEQGFGQFVCRIHSINVSQEEWLY